MLGGDTAKRPVLRPCDRQDAHVGKAILQRNEVQYFHKKLVLLILQFGSVRMYQVFHKHKCSACCVLGNVRTDCATSTTDKNV